MPYDKQIEYILTELYEVDATFRQHEQELIEIIEKLIATKPDTKLDKKFIMQLRAQLLAVTANQNPAPKFINNFNFMKKIGYLVGGTVIVLAVMIPTLMSTGLFNVKTGGISTADGLSSQQKITLLPKQAFGSLINTAELSGRGAAAGAAPSVATEAGIHDQAGGGGSGESLGLGAAKMMASPEIYPYYRYNYIYNGEPVSLEQNEMEVLRRTAGNLANLTASGLLGKLNLGIINLSALGNAEIKNAYLGQDNAGGYNVSLNFENGMISLDKYVKWQEQYEPVKMSEIPGDTEVIALANQFIKKFNINLENYGEPEVDNRWRVYYEQTPDKENYYLPETLTVIYPLKINDVAVYNQGGEKEGLWVYVDIRRKEVISMNNLTTQTYEGSLYPVQTNIQAMLDVVNSQDQNSTYPEGTRAQVVDIELGTPKVAFTKIWNYKDDRSEELLVPAFVFPVMKKPADMPYSQDSLVVPLVEELLKNQYGYGGGPIMMLEGTRSSIQPPTAPENP